MMPLPAMCLDCNRAASKGDVLCDICRERHDDRIEALRAEERAEEARRGLVAAGIIEEDET